MMQKTDDELLAENLEDLVDDYSYKCEELEKTQYSAHRARCYLELILIQQELQRVVEKLKADDVPQCLWGFAQRILACDGAEFHREAMRLLAESCDELRAMITHAIGTLPPSMEPPPTPQEHLASRAAATLWPVRISKAST